MVGLDASGPMDKLMGANLACRGKKMQAVPPASSMPRTAMWGKIGFTGLGYLKTKYMYRLNP